MGESRRMLQTTLVAALAGLLLAGTAHALEVGRKAPEFTLPNQEGKQIKLADLLGKGPVVIFTFIQAFTGV